MAQCTAPSRGHRTASGAANCPACSNWGRSYSRSSYPSGSSYSSGGGGRSSSYGSSGGGTSRRTRSGRTVSYTPTEWQAVEPYAEKAAVQAQTYPDKRDLFLCHAWNDREGSAKELYGHLKTSGATVWFSEEDIPLGSLQMREIDKGLRNSRIGIVLVTPSLLESIKNEGIAEKELAVLLNTNRVVPVTHGVTFDELYDVSPMLASHSGLSTRESSLDAVAAKIAAAAAALPAA
nr:toll/interleukin-1 receptor domain-containing protein [Streptomyces sp. SID8356]